MFQTNMETVNAQMENALQPVLLPRWKSKTDKLPLIRKNAPAVPNVSKPVKTKTLRLVMIL